MKQYVILLLMIALSSISIAQSSNYTLLLTGASFAVKDNGWFEMGCKQLNATPINRAVSAECIADAANQIQAGKLYSKQELEQIDALIIMHVHEKNVSEDSRIKQNYNDYEFPFDRGNYAGAYQYVVSKYTEDCYRLKDDPSSRFYNTPSGKPVIIVVCTHWHDGRPLFNRTIREFASVWGLPVVEFDKYIGFSKETPHPVTKQQYSLIYSSDKLADDNGVVFGWHPYRGDTYIQKRMSSIFVDKMRQILP